MNSPDLPKFSDGEEVLNNYDFKEEHLALLSISWTNNNINELIGEKIINENKEKDKGQYTIPIGHFILDFRALRFIEKLKDIRDGKVVIDEEYGSYDLANLCYKINQKYSQDTEHHFGLRNTIDL